MVRCRSKYSARDLRERIVIERKARAADGMGGYSETWATEATVWAMWKPLSGSERYQAMRISPEVRVTTVIRFQGDVNGAPYFSAGDRVTARGRTYNIEAVVDVDGAQDWLELALVEGKPS